MGSRRVRWLVQYVETQEHALTRMARSGRGGLRLLSQCLPLLPRWGWLLAPSWIGGHTWPGVRRAWIERLMDDKTLAASNGAHARTDTAQVTAVEAAKTAKPPRLFLFVRHGQTTWNVEGRLPGQLPGVPLTDEGRRQAQQAAVALSGLSLSAVISSPLERARDTAAIIARGWSLDVRLDDRLKDTDVGAWAGRKIEEVAKEDPAWKAFVEHPTEPPPGVESLAAVRDRAVAVVEDARKDASLGDVVVFVAHADVVKVILAHYGGMPIDHIRFLAIGNASLSALAVPETGEVALLGVNWTPLPAWLSPRPQRPPSDAQKQPSKTVSEPTGAVPASPEAAAPRTA